jgi:hypothetical protein
MEVFDMSTQLKLKKSLLRRKRAREKHPFDIETFREKRDLGPVGPILRLISDENENGELKMSEVLLDYIGPLLGPDCSDSDFEKSLSLATLTWNIATMPQEDGDKSYQNVVDLFTKEMKAPLDATEEILDYLIERKLRCFNNIDRMITKYEVVGEGQARQLFVWSVLLEDQDD